MFGYDPKRDFFEQLFYPKIHETRSGCGNPGFPTFGMPIVMA